MIYEFACDQGLFFPLIIVCIQYKAACDEIVIFIVLLTWTFLKFHLKFKLKEH